MQTADDANPFLVVHCFVSGLGLVYPCEMFDGVAGALMYWYHAGSSSNKNALYIGITVIYRCSSRPSYQ